MSVIMKVIKRKSVIFSVFFALFLSFSFISPVQDFAYSNAMTLLSECDERETVYGKSRIIGCWGSAPDVCKDKGSDCRDDEPEVE